MPTIYKNNRERVSIDDAKRLILAALPRETAFKVYGQVDESGNVDFDGPLEVREEQNSNIYETFFERDFLDNCKLLAVEPRMKYRPAVTEYKGVQEDAWYTISHDEFTRFAELFGLSVEVGNPPETGPTSSARTPEREPQGATPAPVTDSGSTHTTPDPKRRLDRLRALGGSATYKRGKWQFTGIVALEASEHEEGRPRSSQKTIRADLQEAAESEREAKRAGFGDGLGQR